MKIIFIENYHQFYLTSQELNKQLYKMNIDKR